MNEHESKKIVRCPHCGEDSIFAPENPFRPFCSHRCRLIDLGEWAEGNHRIAGESVDSLALLENFSIDTEESFH